MVKPHSFTEAQLRKASLVSESRAKGEELRAAIAQFTFGPSNRFCCELFAGVAGPCFFVKDFETDASGIRNVVVQSNDISDFELERVLAYTRAQQTYRDEEALLESVYAEVG